MNNSFFFFFFGSFFEERTFTRIGKNSKQNGNEEMHHIETHNRFSTITVTSLEPLTRFPLKVKYIYFKVLWFFFSNHSSDFSTLNDIYRRNSSFITQ